ncbi:MAG: caspase family protein [Chitinophagaceae bacterium]|nr:caspase family protein [Chitinophagaceae bacterium]
MRQLSIFITFIFCSNLIFAQLAGKGNTYAIVIGISDYKDTDIKKLSFSNRDAVVFADFLMSASGGSVPRQNIKLLIDSAATIGEVDKSFSWLKYNCKEGDKVYFYFSGHGETENVTMFRNGYLICYNTPSVAFVNMGLSIDRLNDIVTTLSTEIKAKVIVITDACHSGTMAGNKFKGNFFAGEQLMRKKKNEIRMASCKPDELSNEKADWGGGRGVFSYYLVNGLQGGLADNNKDQVVSVGELKSYMESAMAKDLVLKNDGDVQTPVIKFDEDFQLATVVESETKKIKEQVINDSIKQVMVMSIMPGAGAEEDAEPSDYFFNQLKKQSLESLTDSFKLNTLATENIAFTLINSIKNSAITQTGKSKLLELESALLNDTGRLARFNLDIASAFLDVGQNVITNYIKGDEAEMERRRYYNSKNNGYDVYTRIFVVALKLSKADKYYSTKAEVFLHYFTALALRLKIPLVEDQKPLIDSALQSLKKALAQEEYAAYIYNELGNIYQFKKEHAEAEKNFIKATQFSPDWALPYSNLGGLYTGLGDYEKAITACNTADSLEKDLHPVKVTMGYINEKKGNLLSAEEYYHNAIDINSRHFAPFERLGFVYMNTTDYARADSFFYEADLRKKGYHFKGNEWEIISGGKDKQQLSPMFCDYDTTNINPTDLFTFFIWGMDQYKYQNYDNAIRILKKVIALDGTNPLVFHYIGKIFFDQKKWEEAEVMFKLAKKYQLNLIDFNSYVDSVKKSVTYAYDNSCAAGFFLMSYYKRVEDYFFTGTMYEAWKHVEEAEINFKEAIRLDSVKLGGYLKLWQLYEKQGRFTEAEDVIKASIVVQSDSITEILDKDLPFDKRFVKKAGMTGKERCDRELNAFYRRAIEKIPEDGIWNYKLGILLYSRAHLNTVIPYFDSIVWFPKLNKEFFIDYDFALNLHGKVINTDGDITKIINDDSFSISDESTTGTSSSISLDIIKGYENDGKNIKELKIPGTDELISLADPVILPRKDGITYLKIAAELLSDKETIADIHFKIGNIYLWAGSKKQAYPYFEKSLGMVSDNANARLKLVDIYAALYKNSSALKQLNYLYDSSQINFEKRMLLAEFNIHAGEFEKGRYLTK